MIKELSKKEDTAKTQQKIDKRIKWMPENRKDEKNVDKR